MRLREQVSLVAGLVGFVEEQGSIAQVAALQLAA